MRKVGKLQLQRKPRSNSVDVTKISRYVSGPIVADIERLFGHIPMHNYYLVCFHSFLQALYWSSLTSKTLSKHQEVEQHYLFVSYETEISMSSAVISFVHVIYKRVQEVTHAKSGTFDSPQPTFRIQGPCIEPV